MAFKKRDLNFRISRWIWELEHYDFSIVHRGGEQMGHADALSRNPVVGAVDDIDLRLEIAQARDPSIIEIKTNLEKGPVDKFELRDSLVYRKTKDARSLFFVPVEMEDNIIRLIHENIGHLGASKYYDKLRSTYWFLG